MNSCPRLLRSVALISLSFSFYLIVFVQSSVIVGTVKDTNGSRISDASIVVTLQKNRYYWRVASRDDGNFSIPGLRPGSYTITVEKEGYKKFERTNFILSALGPTSANPIRMENIRV